MAYPKTHETVINIIKDLDKNIRIVDLGCGKGEVVTKLRELGFRNIEYCGIEDKFDGKVKLMDFDDRIKLKGNSFDLVITTEVVHYLKNRQKFFEEVKRILKPNGILVLSFPNLLNLPNKLVYFFKSRFIDVVLGHFDAFFIWQIPSFFKIEKITYNQGFIPIIRVPFIKNKWFGQTTILKCRVDK